MKPIETRYKGYRFRSRLEARWAVFFEAIGLKWEYEPEGFDLGMAGWYLPDFRVLYPGRNSKEMHYEWFEVKGDLINIGIDECKKMISFALSEDLTILDGPPRPTMFEKLSPDNGVTVITGDGTNGGPVDAIGLKNRLRQIANTADDKRFGWALWSPKGRMWIDESFYYFSPTTYFGSCTDIEYACSEARFVRFEHGESP